MDEGPATKPPGVEKDLGMVADEVEALRDLASDPAKSEDGSRVYDFSIRWGVLLSGRLKRLEHYYRAGALSEEQERGYRQLRQVLKAAAPQMKRLGVGRPAVPLED